MYLNIPELNAEKIELNRDKIEVLDKSIIYKGIQYENKKDINIDNITFIFTLDKNLIFEEENDEIELTINY